MPQRVQVGSVLQAGATFARPGDSTPYAVNDAIANSTTNTLVVPMQFTVTSENGATGNIVGAQQIVNSATAYGAMRLWLFNIAPFADAGYQADNAAIALTLAALTTGAAPGPLGNCIGYIDFATFVARTSSAISVGVCPQTELPFQCGPGSKVIFGLLEAMAIFTPANAGTFTTLLDVRAQ